MSGELFRDLNTHESARDPGIVQAIGLKFMGPSAHFPLRQVPIQCIVRDMTPRPTPIAYAAVLVRNIRAARSRAGLDQADVVTRMRELGFDTWHRQTMGKVERSERRVTAEEIIGLALALETTVPRLLEPLTEDEWVQIPSGESLPPGVFTDLVRGRIPEDFTWYKNSPVRAGRAAAALEFEAAWPAAPGPQQQADSGELGRLPRPGRQSVIMGIVTSDRGVLVTRRVDQNPPWGFTAGWGEPGESHEDTIVREVKEEADLLVRVGEYLGERDHPATGFHVVYYAARPTHGTEIHLGDKGELLEVRWVSLAEADELMGSVPGGIYGPVRAYLARELGES